ncbi:MAG: DHA2 family efflux MFS transporter permease subunit [Acidobacteriota bacterium]
MGSAGAGASVRHDDPSAARWTLAAAILGSSIAFLDANVVSVALPVIQKNLSATVSSAQWVVEAYALFLSALVLVGGSLADRFGRRRVFVVGVAAFAAASVLCGLAPSAPALIAARAAQGIAAALLVPSSLAILAAAYPPGKRGRAIGTWSALTSISGAVGPVLGGWLVEAASWRAVFFLNVPIAAVVLVIARAKIRESRNPGAGGVDVPGALLATAGLGGVVFGLIELPSSGWGAPLVFGPLAGGTACLVALVAVEHRRSSPMVPIALFRIRAFAATNILTFFLYGAFGAAFFFLPFELIQGKGYSSAAAGAAMLPIVLLISSLSRTAGKLADRLGPRLFLTAGPSIVAAGFLLLALRVPEHGYVSGILPGACAMGLGMALTVAPLTTTVLNAVDRRQSGAASGINNAVARVAGLLFIAAVGVVASRAFDRDLDRRLASPGFSSAARAMPEAERRKLGAARAPSGLPEPERRKVQETIALALGSSFRVVMEIGAALALLAGACAAFGLRSGGPQSERSSAKAR